MKRSAIAVGRVMKDRSTLPAELARDELRRHLQRAEAQYRADRAAGLAGVWMPEALERKYPNAGRELGWFWVFPSHTLSTDPRAGIVRRHYLSDSVIQKAVKAAAIRAQIHKPISVHTLRHQLCHPRVMTGAAGRTPDGARRTRSSRQARSIAAKRTILNPGGGVRCKVSGRDHDRRRPEVEASLRNHALKTVNNVLTVLSALLKKAVEWDVIERVPCTIRLVRAPKPSMGFYDFDEYERLLEVCSDV